MQILAGFNCFIYCTRVVNIPLGIMTQMSYVCDVFIAKLFYAHLARRVRPGIKVDFTTLSVERKVFYTNKALGV